MFDDISLLEERLERERTARVEAERTADDTIRDLYERQCEFQLLRAVAFAANDAQSIEEAMRASLESICRNAGFAVGHVFFADAAQRLVSSNIWHDEGGRFEAVKHRTNATAFGPGVGLPGRVVTQGILVWIEDLTELQDMTPARELSGFGLRVAVGVPVLVGTQVRAVLELFGEQPRPLEGHLVDLMSQVGTILGRVLEREQAKRELHDANRRLTRALVELQEAQDQIVQQERLRALGQMSSGIAHDFNNALHPIVGYAELLKELPEIAQSADAMRYLRNILTSATDAAAVVSRLREFYRTREDEDVMVPTDLRGLVRQVADLTRPRWYNEALAEGVRIEMVTELGEVPPMLGHEPQLREAITNLVLNAVDAMPGGGTIVLRTRMDEGRVTVDVSDTGTGMTEEVRLQCLEPFFTTKGDRGSGLGLGMVYGIVNRHDGLLAITSTVGVGTTMTISFPAAQSRTAVASATVSPTLSSALRVLVVDDKEAARDLVTELLEADGHWVEAVPDGVEALARLAEARFDIVVTDRSMPAMSGDELARTIKESGTPLPVLMITGFGVLMLSAGECPFGVDLVLPKPVTRAALRQALATLQPAVSSAA